MKKYTQAEFDAIKRDEDGYLRLPTGDYCDVDFEGASRVIIGASSELGNGCELGDECELGNGCTLGDGCKLGNWCKLGEGCTLESDRVHNATHFKVSNIGSRNGSAYCYCDTYTGEIYVRAGCWFSGIDDFTKRVHKVHAGTQHEVDYLAMVEFAQARFARYKKARGEHNG